MRRLAMALAAACLPAIAGAQDALLPQTSWGLAPIYSSWNLNTAIGGGRTVRDVSEFAVPFRARTTLGDNWSMDVSGAFASGQVNIRESDGSLSKLALGGVTDIKLRASGNLAGDALLLTLGLNLPTGATKLGGDQTTALQALGAPALRLPVGAFGTGAGATVGLVGGFQREQWAYGLGVSIEQRTEYTPIALSLSSGTSSTAVTPGTAIHVSLGADGVVGESRVNFLVITDFFAKDKVVIGSGGNGADARGDYTLGPQVTAIAAVDLSAPGWRERSFNVSVRQRTAFTDASGARVSGSSGTYLDAAWNGVRGRTDGPGFVIGFDARWQSGLSFTESLVGAQAMMVGETVGVEWPTDGALFRIAARAQGGSLTTTGGKSKVVVGFGLVGAIAARRESH